MRNLLLISLLATAGVAMPLQAQDHREQSAEQSDQRSSASDRGSRRPERSFSRRSDDTPQSQSRPERDRPVMRERRSESGQQVGGFARPDRGDDNNGPASVSSSAGDTVRNWHGRSRRADSPTQIQDRNLGSAPADMVDNRSIEDRNLRRVDDGALDRNVRTTPGFGDRRLRRMGNNVPVEGTAPPPVSSDVARRGDSHRRWTSDWRRDGRYDWRRYRDRHRSRFHLGFYFDPFGWNYRRYSIGWRLWPDYYHSSYWLNDPWYYRLPPAYGPYRWIRYHDDALLVNIYTGTVVDVIYNFFW